MGIIESKVCAETFGDIMKTSITVDHVVMFLHRMNVAGMYKTCCSRLVGRLLSWKDHVTYLKIKLVKHV